MENGITGETISHILSVCSIIVSILVFNAAVKERHSKSAAEQAGLATKLDTALKTLDKMSTDIEELRSDRAKDQAAIAELATKVSGLDRRVSSLETKMHDYHAK